MKHRRDIESTRHAPRFVLYSVQNLLDKLRRWGAVYKSNAHAGGADVSTGQDEHSDARHGAPDALRDLRLLLLPQRVQFVVRGRLDHPGLQKQWAAAEAERFSVRGVPPQGTVRQPLHPQRRFCCLCCAGGKSPQWFVARCRSDGFWAQIHVEHTRRRVISRYEYTATPCTRT